MGVITGVRSDIYTEEVAYRSAVSEATMVKIAENVQYSNDLVDTLDTKIDNVDADLQGQIDDNHDQLVVNGDNTLLYNGSTAHSGGTPTVVYTVPNNYVAQITNWYFTAASGGNDRFFHLRTRSSDGLITSEVIEPYNVFPSPDRVPPAILLPGSTIEAVILDALGDPATGTGTFVTTVRAVRFGTL